jgi:hypothetical protein
MATIYNKRPQIIPYGHKIFQMVIIYTNILYSKALQNLPKFRFWFENKPSGNPDVDPNTTSSALSPLLSNWGFGVAGGAEAEAEGFEEAPADGTTSHINPISKKTF